MYKLKCHQIRNAVKLIVRKAHNVPWDTLKSRVGHDLHGKYEMTEQRWKGYCPTECYF